MGPHSLAKGSQEGRRRQIFNFFKREELPNHIYTKGKEAYSSLVMGANPQVPFSTKGGRGQVLRRIAYKGMDGQQQSTEPSRKFEWNLAPAKVNFICQLVRACRVFFFFFFFFFCLAFLGELTLAIGLGNPSSIDPSNILWKFCGSLPFNSPRFLPVPYSVPSFANRSRPER